jgi:hypothetical protein
MEPQGSIVLDQSSVVHRHAAFFAKADQTLTHCSITNGHSIQGITTGVDVKARAILNILSDSKKEPTVPNICHFYNPASSGIWDKDGNFNSAQFEKLRARSIRRADASEIITESIFKDFVSNEQTGKTIGVATHVFYLVPIQWTQVTNGSIEELFRYYSDCEYTNEEGKTEKAMTIDKLRQFYTDPVSVMKERISSK